MNSLIDRITSIVKEATPAYPNVSSGTLPNTDSYEKPLDIKGKGKITLIYGTVSSYHTNVTLTIDGCKTVFSIGGYYDSSGNVRGIYPSDPTFTFESSCSVSADNTNVNYIVQLAD